MNNHTKAATYLLQLCNMFYEKTKDTDVETAISSLRLLIMNGECEMAFKDLYVEILKFASKQKELIHAKDVKAFDYEYTMLPNHQDKKEIFARISDQAKKMYHTLTETERNLFWTRINNLIAVVVKISLN